jgi:hypothetical protein
MMHEHKHGQLVEPHMRCVVGIDREGNTVTLDVDLGLYLTLDKSEVPDRVMNPQPGESVSRN